MSIKAAVEPQAGASRGRVLVVDDSRVVRAIVCHALRKGGFQVDEADNGATALQILKGARHDVVITDLRMPGLDGFEVLAGVKQLDPNVEVIILTGSFAHDVNSAVKALRLGAHDFLMKPPTSAEQVIATVDRAVESKRLKDANRLLVQELQALSRTDALTGVANRRSLDEALSRETARSHRHGQPLSVVMLDIDHFKKVNDIHGHQGGDTVIQAFARTVASELREGDELYRYGGEEFALLLANTGLEGAITVAHRIVAAVAAKPIRISSTNIRITTSAGAACLGPLEDGPALIAEADAALYDAKSTGRNRAIARGLIAHVTSLKAARALA
jgi:diguanylate cyclase (GGDEF)-like protein